MQNKVSATQKRTETQVLKAELFGLGKVDLWKFNVEKLVPEIIYGCCKNRDFQSFPYWTKGPGINLAFLNGNDSGTQLVKESVDNVMQENSYLS